MNPFFITPVWLIVAVIILVIVLSNAHKQRRLRWMQQQFGSKVCPRCGTNQPHHAAFCRQCGQQLD